jgi:hypothetical protein
MGRARHPVDDRFGELLDVVLKCLLGDRDRRAGCHVVHRETGLDSDDVGKVVGPAPGVDVTGHSSSSKCRGELTDIHVHPAAVPRTGLGQR